GHEDAVAPAAPADRDQGRGDAVMEAPATAGGLTAPPREAIAQPPAGAPETPASSVSPHPDAPETSASGAASPSLYRRRSPARVQPRSEAALAAAATPSAPDAGAQAAAAHDEKAEKVKPWRADRRLPSRTLLIAAACAAAAAVVGFLLTSSGSNHARSS